MPLSKESLNWLTENHFDPYDLNKPGKYEDSPLIAACRQGKADLVDQLLAANVDIHHRNMDGTDALWAAAVANSMEIADKLLAAGINIDNQNENGASVLMYAASTGKSAWVWYLLNQGANMDLESLDGFSATELASNVDCLKLLRRWKQQNTETISSGSPAR